MEEDFSFVLPRDEKEISMLFDILLFFRSEAFSSDAQADKHQKPLSYPAQRLLRDSNTINRMFRAWYQCTWGDRTWNVEFDGETPRQELGIHNADIKNGDAMLSVEFERRSDGDGLCIEPRLFDKETLAHYGGPFSYGVHELAQNPEALVVAPNFDPDFRIFAQALREQVVLRTGKEPTDDRDYWHVFWQSRGALLLEPFLKDVSPALRASYGAEVQTHLDAFALANAAGALEYIVYDRLFQELWLILQRIDSSLADAEFVLLSPEGEYDDDPAYAHGITTMFLLNNAFERHILFPADRYFNAAELVWQAKDTFVDSLQLMWYLLQHKLVPPREDGPDTLAKRALQEIGLRDKIMGLETMWFNPCTCFRFIGTAHAYFTELITIAVTHTKVPAKSPLSVAKKEVTPKSSQSTRKKMQKKSVASAKGMSESPHDVYQLKITIRHVKPAVWRRILINSDATLWDLYTAIIDAFGWTGMHLFGFRVPGRENGRIAGVPNPEGDLFGGETVPAWKEHVHDWLDMDVQRRLVLDYDYGDGWEHDILLEGTLPSDENKKMPQCVAGKRACPLEDCGGPWAYMELLEVLKDPKHSSRQQWIEQLAGGELEEGEELSDYYDPEEFDVEEVVFDSHRDLLTDFKKGWM